IAYSVDADAAGNSYVVGIYGAPITFGTITLTGGGIFIVKYEGSGTALWAIGVPGGSANAVTVIPSGDIYVAGTIYSPSITFGSTTLTNAGVYDMFLAKLATSTGIPIANGTASGSAFTVYPNPATDELRIEDSGFRIDAVEIYDVLGKKILSEQPGTKHQALSTINVSSLTPGIYFIFVRQNQSITTRKVVIQ
ncbi:MAG TPA: T9SS type A sorting domain-containing protein, partial [Bacteroidia bacterium]|nr:T9SS type A sorting domain-containing protein [Bacteroidia bacterium]